MTIVSVKVEKKEKRIARVRKTWVEDAAEYFFTIGVFDRKIPQEVIDCVSVAESVYENCMNKDGSIDSDIYDPISAVKEELTYWGE